VTHRGSSALCEKAQKHSRKCQRRNDTHQSIDRARAAYLMLPPNLTSQDYRADQERESDGIAKGCEGFRPALCGHLSSYGAQAPEGTGPIAGLHSSEQKLNAISA